MRTLPWWRNRTVVIVAGCLIAIITFGTRTSFGLFTEPLSALRGWDRETFALAIAIQNLLWGIGQPFAGAIADRYGAGRVLAAGGAVYALGTVLMATSTSAAAFNVTGGVLVGLGLAGGSFTIVIAAFARLVPEDRRSWAMGLATAAGSMGQFPVRAARAGIHTRLRPRHGARPAGRVRGDRPAPGRRAERAPGGDGRGAARVDRRRAARRLSTPQLRPADQRPSSCAASTSRSSPRTFRRTSPTSASASAWPGGRSG
jgi:hypothetical protein